jgi:hypothetical protein
MRFHGGEENGGVLLDCNAALIRLHVLMFRRNILSPSSGYKMEAFPEKLKLRETVS